MELVWLGWWLDRIGHLRTVDLDGILEPFTRDVVDAEQRALEARDIHIRDSRVCDVSQRDALAARSGHILQHKPLQRLVWMNRGAVDQHRLVCYFDVPEFEIPNGRDSLISRNQILIRDSTVQDIETQEPKLRTRDFKVVHVNVFDERSATGSALDIDGKSSSAEALAVVHMDIANAARGLAANSDACPNFVSESAV